MCKLLLVSLASLFLLCGAAQAVTYYVDVVNGSNANPGTLASPWKTITYAAATSATGDTVNAAPGTYNAAAGESFPITITGRHFISTTTGLATIDSASAVANTVNLGNTANPV